MILIGGVLYLLGVIFYLWKKYPYNQAVRHFFALAAAVCHNVAILLAVQQPVFYQTFFLAFSLLWAWTFKLV